MREAKWRTLEKTNSASTSMIAFGVAIVIGCSVLPGWNAIAMTTLTFGTQGPTLSESMFGNRGPRDGGEYAPAAHDEF